MIEPDEEELTNRLRLTVRWNFAIHDHHLLNPCLLEAI